MTPKFLLGGLVTLLGVFVVMANKVTVSPERPSWRFNETRCFSLLRNVHDYRLQAT